MDKPTFKGLSPETSGMPGSVGLYADCVRICARNLEEEAREQGLATDLAPLRKAIEEVIANISEEVA